MKRRFYWAAAGVLVSAGVFAGATLHWGKPDAAGAIATADPPYKYAGGPLLGSLRVNDYDFTLNTRTLLLERQGVVLRPVAFSDLKPGQEAQVWHTGTVQESYPARATARLVIVQTP